MVCRQAQVRGRQGGKLRAQPPSDEQIGRWMLDKFEPVVWDLLDLKVLDPAMGSAHFLVETVDYITDRVLDFLAGFPTNPVQVVVDQRIRRQILEALDQQEVKINEQRLTDVNLIKRLVMKRCVYGVDLNPMAVELAKVSLWLDSFTLVRTALVSGPSFEVRQFAGRHHDRGFETGRPRLGLRHQDGAARAGDGRLGGGCQSDRRHAQRGHAVGGDLQEGAGWRPRLSGRCWIA